MGRYRSLGSVALLLLYVIVAVASWGSSICKAANTNVAAIKISKPIVILQVSNNVSRFFCVQNVVNVGLKDIFA